MAISFQEAKDALDRLPAHHSELDDSYNYSVLYEYFNQQQRGCDDEGCPHYGMRHSHGKSDRVFQAVLMQAKIWAHAAKTYRAIVYECYQECTDATGEPGTWRGAGPVRNFRNEYARQSRELRSKLIDRPSTRLLPKVFADGNVWCALYGNNMMDGVAAFGDSPHAAMLAFDEAWVAKFPPRVVGRLPS